LTATAKIINARIPGYPGLQQMALAGDMALPLEQAEILDIVPKIAPDLPTLDLDGDWCSLGGVDLQINGGLGLAFPDLQAGDRDKLTAICQYLWAAGVDGFVPTLVTTSIEKFQRSLAIFKDFMQQQTSGTAQILGVHLEGPCLNLEKRGAHPAKFLLPLTIESLQQVIGDYGSIVKIVTLAPELDPTGSVIPYLRQKGIVVSLGHSQATIEQGTEAFQEGATMVTHAFNAMPSLHHRQPGLLAAALTMPGVRSGFIADGQHVHPTMLKIFLQAANYDEHAFLVSDALAPLGLPDGVYPWDSRQIEVRQGTARLADGTLSGTTLPLLDGVDNLVEWGVCDLERGISLATMAPRRAIGAKGTYRGAPASLIRWQQKTGQMTRTRLNWSDFS
jgi:N-acetylglucosamine-6-phosphate deacetylase